MADLDATTELLRLLGDPSRVRLLSLLARHELSIAELVAVTGLAQSRVSTHLAALRAAGLVRARKVGAATRQALADDMPADASRLWSVVGELDDPVLTADLGRAEAAIAARAGGSWADEVAGTMARHYSPGRTWESALRVMVGLARPGRVLDVASGDGALAELLAPHADAVTCLDRSARIVAAGAKRTAALGNVRFVEGDMHALPFPDGSFDAVMLTSALELSPTPERVLAECARVLVPGGAFAASALAAHGRREAVAPFDHVQLGFEPDALRELASRAGFAVRVCAVTSRERRPPHFEVVSLHASR